MITSAYLLGAKSLANLEGVDPRLVDVAKLAITLTKQDFGFAQPQVRTEAEQAALVAKGVSQTMQSRHLPQANGMGGAVDAVPWTGQMFSWEWPLIYPIVAAFKAASLQLGIDVTWGGCWDRLLSEIEGDDANAMLAAQRDYTARRGGKAFIDGPHYELGRN